MSPRRPDPKPEKYVTKAGVLKWTIRFRPDPKKGPTTRHFDTHHEALTFAADVRDFGGAGALLRMSEREGRTAGPAGPLLDDVFTEFIAWKRSDVRSSRTIEEYQSQYAHVIGPTFGHRHITDITDTDVQRWVDGMTAGTIGARLAHGEYVPLSAKSITNRHGLLHSVMDYASSRRRRYITVNPCTDTDLPKRRKGLPKGLRPGEWAALHAALQQVDPDAADLALALYATGARLGEISALTTWDVQDDGTHVTVTIDHVIRRLARGVFERVEDTKSDAGFRVVEVGAGPSEMFRRRVGAARPGGPVFTNPRSTKPPQWWHPAAFYPSWYRAVELANLDRRPTPHWLRHTHVQGLMDRGVRYDEIQTRVGHESIKTTVDTYGRLRRGVAVSVLDALDGPSLPAVEGTVIASHVITEETQ